MRFQVPSGSQDMAGNRTWIAFLNGARIRYAMVHPVNNSFGVTVPAGLIGTSFAVWTKDDHKLTDENTLAGPALVTFPYNSEGELE